MREQNQQSKYAMEDCSLKAVSIPVQKIVDPLTELLRNGARELISQAVEAKLAEMLANYSDLKLVDGRQVVVVRNGYLPERRIPTGIGDVTVKVPKVRDRSGSGIQFNSHLLPPYLRRIKSIEELIPWLYLKGLSSSDYSETLCSLLSEDAKGLSANTVCRLKSQWLSTVAASGLEPEALCLLVGGDTRLRIS